jgi:hypothetical protein
MRGSPRQRRAEVGNASRTDPNLDHHLRHSTGAARPHRGGFHAREDHGGEVRARISCARASAPGSAFVDHVRCVRRVHDDGDGERVAAAARDRLHLGTCAVHLRGHRGGGRQARAFGTARSGRRHSQKPHRVRPRGGAGRRDFARQGAAAGAVSRSAVRSGRDQLAGQSAQCAGRLRDRNRRTGESARPGVSRRGRESAAAGQRRRDHAASADAAHR